MTSFGHEWRGHRRRIDGNACFQKSSGRFLRFESNQRLWWFSTFLFGAIMLPWNIFSLSSQSVKFHSLCKFTPYCLAHCGGSGNLLEGSDLCLV